MKHVILHPLPKPINATISLPGCIGYTIRALNIAAMVKGEVTIVNPLKSDDTYKMLNALVTLGIDVEEGKDYFLVKGDISQIQDKAYTIDIGLSGRTARSIVALLCIVPGKKTVTCSVPFKNRPIGDLVDGLRQLGAKIDYREDEGHLPIKILSSKLIHKNAKMAGKVSSQYFSSLMMIAPLASGLTIDVIGEQSSKPFIDMTIAIMKDFGVTVENNEYKQYKITNTQTYTNPKIYKVEPEATSASYFFAIAALTKSTIRVRLLDPQSHQGDIRFVALLKTMGCLVKQDDKEKWIEVTGTQTLQGITVSMNDTPDLVPTLAVVAAFSQGQTTITDIAHVRVKETDRIASPQKELTKMGITTKSTEDTLTIFGGEPNAATIDTYHDHRMAMAFAVAGSKIAEMKINDPAVVNKSFPEFWEKLKQLGIHMEEKI